MTTHDMEMAIYQHLRKLGVYLCFEVSMPYFSEIKQKWMCSSGRCDERVDLLQYSSKKEWRFYELKLSKKDFYSKHKHTFYGHFNYFVMPKELYEQVKQDIPAHVGVFAVYPSTWKKIGYEVESLKKAKRCELGIPEEHLLFKFMQACARETDKRLYSSLCGLQRLREEEKGEPL